MPEVNASLHSEVLLDTQGLYCPEPVMLLHQAIRQSQSGTIIKVLATDPSTTRDIPKFCLHLGHELVEQAVEDRGVSPVYSFAVRKR